MSNTETINNTGTKAFEQTKKPAMYAVVVHNDPYTPRDFVVEVLQKCFQKSAEEAARIMLKAHKTGVGVVSIYTLEIAETKAAIANQYSHDHGKLLLFSVEEA
ncbi:MAG: ATP-dependent Clp protease adaptor ClpS [Proteobacteria bacterium]|nr:MAG: ATP-dependent Clp protease adaptor ClpS [Pseudomonadota bacterium]